MYGSREYILITENKLTTVFCVAAAVGNCVYSEYVQYCLTIHMCTILNARVTMNFMTGWIEIRTIINNKIIIRDHNLLWLFAHSVDCCCYLSSKWTTYFICLTCILTDLIDLCTIDFTAQLVQLKTLAICLFLFTNTYWVNVGDCWTRYTMRVKIQTKTRISWLIKVTVECWLNPSHWYN